MNALTPKRPPLASFFKGDATAPSTELRTFTFKPTEGVEFNIRTVMLAGVPWFVAADVCRALGLKARASGAISHHLRALAPDERQLRSMSGLFPKREAQGGAHSILLISESGLYKLIMRSDKPEARKFQDWVTRTVLPTIRQTGSYVLGEEHIAPGEDGDDELILRVIESLRRKIAKRDEDNKALAAKVVTVEAENAHTKAVIRQELDYLTVNEFVALSHRYLPHGDKGELGKAAARLSRSAGVAVTRGSGT